MFHTKPCTCIFTTMLENIISKSPWKRRGRQLQCEDSKNQLQSGDFLHEIGLIDYENICNFLKVTLQNAPTYSELKIAF